MPRPLAEFQSGRGAGSWDNAAVAIELHRVDRRWRPCRRIQPEGYIVPVGGIREIRVARTGPLQRLRKNGTSHGDDFLRGRPKIAAAICSNNNQCDQFAEFTDCEY